MTIEELQVLITANTKQLQSEIAKTNKTVSSLQKTTDKAQVGITGAFSKLKSGIIALGIGKVIKDSVMTGINAIESDSLFETSLGNMADDVRSWSNEIENILGVSGVALRKNTGVIYNMTTSMGLAEDNALKMSKGISLLSEDMASFYNLSSDEAFNKLRAGLTGETEPLKALGILVDENTIKQVAYQQGIAQTGSELTQQQKVLARYVAILKQTGNAQGDLARTIDSPANQLRLLKSQVSQLGLALGNLLIPVLKAVLPYITAFFKLVTMGVNALASLLGLTKKTSSSTSGISSGFGGVADSVGDISNGVGNVSSGLGDVNDGLKDANKNAKKLKGTLASFDEMNVLQDNSSDSTSGASGGVGGGLGGGVGDFGSIGADGLFDLSEYDAKLDTVKSKVDEIVEKMKSALGSIKNVIVDVWNSTPVQAFAGAVTSWGQYMWDYWSTMGMNLSNNIATTWGNIQGNVGITLENMTLLWTNFWTDIDAGIQEWGQPIIDSTSKLFNSIWKDAIDPYIQLVSQKWADFSKILVDLWEKHGAPLVNNIGEFAKKTVDLFQSIWDNVIEPIVTPFLEMLTELWDKHLKGMMQEVGDLVGTVINAALTIYNKFIVPVVDFLLKVLSPAWTTITNLITNKLGAVLGYAIDSVKNMAKIFRGFIDFLMGVFTLDWSRAWEGIKTIFSGMWDSVASIFKAGINIVIGGINSFISGLNKISFDLPDWEVLGDWAGKKMGFNIKKLKKLARGGVVDSPTPALIGEAGKEVVMPLERNTGWIDELASKINSKGGDGTPINLVVKLGEDTIFEKFIDYTKEKSFETNGEVFSL